MKKIVTLICTTLIFSILYSCGQKSEIAQENNTEEFNNWYYVRMDNGAIYRDKDLPYVIDFDNMNTSVICNIPNCSHSTNNCLITALKSSEQLPIIYNGAAYFFENKNGYIEKDGKNALDLSFKLRKYNFNNCEFSDIAEVKDFNANVDDGCYLIGTNYYFTTNIGNPTYDELGNVSSSSTSGGGNLFCINLENGTVTDYGEVFDYESLKKQYPSAQNSLSMYLMGKIDNQLYIGINFMKKELTHEMMQNGETPLFYGETHTFDLNTHKITKLDDEFSMCSMNGYHSYYPSGNNTSIMLQNVTTGEITQGPDILSWNAMTIFDDKVWHDDAKCFDIKTGKDEKLSSYNCGQVIAEYNDSYIFMGEDDKGKTFFEKLHKNTSS